MTENPIPPLPQNGSTIGARHLWMVWAKSDGTCSEAAQHYRDLFGREPDRMHSPEESATDWWWLGWISRAEAARLRRGA